MQTVIHDSDSTIQLLASQIGESWVALDGGSLTCWDAIEQARDTLEWIQDSLLQMDHMLDVCLDNLGKIFVNMSTHNHTMITNRNDQLSQLSCQSSVESAGYGVLGIYYHDLGLVRAHIPILDPSGLGASELSQVTGPSV
jgi:hypothetical protein